MPLGERIGQAYVKVILDGEGNRDFGDQLRAAGEDAGRDSGFGTAEAFDKEFTKTMRKRIRANSKVLAKDVEVELAKQFRRSKLIEKELGTAWFKNFESGVRARVKNSDIADVMMRDIRKKFVQSGGNRSLLEGFLGGDPSSLGRFRSLLDSAAAEVESVRKAEARKSEADQQALEKRLKSLSKEAEKFSVFVQQSGRHFITTNAEVLSMRREVERLSLGLQAAFDENVINELDFNRLSADLKKFNHELDVTNVSINRAHLRSRVFGDALGRISGRGSRNDFLNFIGSMTRNVFNLVATVSFGMARFATSFVKGFSAARKAGEGFFKAIAAGLGGGLSFFGIIAKLGPVAIGIFATLFVVIGPLISLITSLGGALIALGLSVGGGLVGGLGILGALLAPLTFGIGGLIAAIVSMDDATKAALKKSIQPFTALMKELGKTLATAAFRTLKKDITDLTAAFKDPIFSQFAQQIGDGLNTIRERMVDAFESDRFKFFFRDMGVAFRDQLVAMGDILIGFGSGFAGTIRALEGPVDTFLGRLRGVGNEFARWANTEAGQAALRTFFTGAEESLAKIGSLLRSTGKLFAVAFNEGGAAAGNTLIDRFKAKIEDLTNYIKSNPGVVEAWFGRAVDTASKVGGAILALSGALARLGTEGAQERLNTVLDLLVKIAGAIEFIGNVGGLIGALNVDLGSDDIVGEFQQIGDAWGKLFADPAPKAAVTDLSTSFTGFTGLVAANPIRPTVDPSGLRGLSESYGVLKQDALTVNQTPITPTVNPFAIDSLSGSLDVIAGQIQAPKELVINAPQDPVLGLIEKINFLSLSMQALRGNAVGMLVTAGAVAGINNAATAAGRLKTALSTVKAPKITVPGLPAVISQVTRLGTQLNGLKPKALVIRATAITAAITATTRLNALALKPKTLTVNYSSATAAVTALNKINSTTLKNKSFDVHVGLSGPGKAFVKRGGVFGGNTESIMGSLFGDAVRMAAGGIANSTTRLGNRIIGESGAEAVVPLSRPLGQVDPSVRMLSAIAQGKVDLGYRGPQVEANGWTIVTPTEDPGAVAQEALNRLVAMAY
jgi:hypothetical protein